jgi:hypothetical protein
MSGLDSTLVAHLWVLAEVMVQPSLTIASSWLAERITATSGEMSSCMIQVRSTLRGVLYLRSVGPLLQFISVLFQFSICFLFLIAFVLHLRSDEHDDSAAPIDHLSHASSSSCGWRRLADSLWLGLES